MRAVGRFPPPASIDISAPGSLLFARAKTKSKGEPGRASQGCRRGPQGPRHGARAAFPRCSNIYLSRGLRCVRAAWQQPELAERGVEPLGSLGRRRRRLWKRASVHVSRRSSSCFKAGGTWGSGSGTPAGGGCVGGEVQGGGQDPATHGLGRVARSRPAPWPPCCAPPSGVLVPREDPNGSIPMGAPRVRAS